MSDYIFQSPSTRYTRVEAFDSQSQLQNSGEIASITDVTNNFFVPQDVQKKRPYSQYQSRSNTQHSILNNTNNKIDDRSPSASNIYRETDMYNAIYSTENYQVMNESNETNIRNFRFNTQQAAPTVPTTVRTRLHDIYSSPNEDRRASSNRYGLRESLASSPYKSRSLSKTKRVLGSSEQSPRRDKTSGKQRIQKMRDAAEASKSSIAKKEYKSFTVTTKSGNEIPHKITKDFLSSRSTKTLATPKLKEREALATTAPINISASTNVHTVQFTNTSIVSSRKQTGEIGQKLRTKRLSNIPTQIDVSNNVEILGATSNLSAKDSTTKSRKAYINQIYSQILKKHLGGCTPGTTVATTKAGAHKAVEKKVTSTRPATATPKVNTHNLNYEAKRRKENATALAQTKKENVAIENPNEETRVPVIRQEVLRPKTVAKFKRSDTLNIKRSSNTNLNVESPVASARAQSKEPRANSKEPRANSKEPRRNSKEPIQQRRVTANLVQARNNSVAQISSKNPHSLNNYKFERILGQGAYAVVKLAMDKIRGEKVAVKIYEKHNLQDPRRMKNVRREISILQSLDHPNIIKMHDSFDTPKQIHMVMEYASKTSLHSFLRSLGSRRLTDNEIRNIVLQIGKGLHYCHEKKIIHRDVKLENILLDEDNNVKIIDFGFSIIASEEHKLNIYCGTPSYMAPEIAGKVQYKGAPTDVWSLGIILFILLCGHFPFKGNDDRELFAKIKKAKYEIPDFVSKGGRGLLKKILKANPDERLKINEILEDSWINERDEE